MPVPIFQLFRKLSLMDNSDMNGKRWILCWRIKILLESLTSEQTIHVHYEHLYFTSLDFTLQSNNSSKQHQANLTTYACSMFKTVSPLRLNTVSNLCVKVIKSKAVPLSPCRRQEEMKYSSNTFLTSLLDAGEWSASQPSRALLSRNRSRYPLDRRLVGPHSWSEHRG
jgi:hypothetical protein